MNETRLISNLKDIREIIVRRNIDCDRYYHIELTAILNPLTHALNKAIKQLEELR